MSPVGAATIDVCFTQVYDDLNKSEEESDKNKSLPPYEDVKKDVLETLKKQGLLNEMEKVTIPKNDNAARLSKRYALHPLVRGYVFYRLQGARYDKMPNFMLPGFTSRPSAVYPGTESSADLVKNLLNSLIKESKDRYDNASNVDDKEDARELARSAFSVMRSRMEATSVAKWSKYDEYGRYAVNLINLILHLSGKKLWDFSDSTKHLKDEHAILYPEQLAWLYNEIGTTYYWEGYMANAYAILEQGYEINKLIEKGESGQFVVQSLLHLGFVYIELGNIERAEDYIKEADRANHLLKSSDYEGRILGYKGLIAHLRDDREEAGKCYKRCLKILKKERRESKGRE